MILNGHETGNGGYSQESTERKLNLSSTLPQSPLESGRYGVIENGSCEAQKETYDDRVISFGIGLAINKRSGLSAIFPNLR
jgi:hypothetical protein